MQLAKYIFLALILSGCSDSTMKLEPGDHVLQFLESQDYELLSEADRSVWSRDKWSEQSRWWRTPGPALSPTHKYYALERYLYEFASYQLKEVTDNQDGSYSVTVNYRRPTELEEVDLFIRVRFGPDLNEDEVDKLENLMIAYEGGRLTPTTIKYIENEHVFTVVSGGVFINAEEKQMRCDEIEKVEQLFSQLSHIGYYNLDFDFGTPSELMGYLIGLGQATRIKDLKESRVITQIKNLRAIGVEQIRLDISSLGSAIIQLSELQANVLEELMCNSSGWEAPGEYPVLKTLAKLHEARVLLEADSIFSDSLRFNEVMVAEEQGGHGIGLFFDWSITSNLLPDEAVSAGFQARYFDDDSNQIGSEDFLASSIRTENGRREGRIGKLIDDQDVAQRTSSVEVSYLLPWGTPWINCKLDETVVCEEETWR